MNEQPLHPADAGPLPYLQFGPLYVVPSLHSRLAFADLVRAAYFALQPDAVAVELPATLEPSIRKGVERLPYISVVGYKDYDEDMEEIQQILPITPEDSLMEAVRLALEHGTPLHFIDRDVIGHQSTPLRLPDDYLVRRIGLAGYWQAVQGALEPPEAGSEDEARNQEMAAHLRTLTAKHERVLFVCGLAHLAPILDLMAKNTAPPAGAVTQREQTLFNLSQDSVGIALGEMPFAVYWYELGRKGANPQDYPQLIPLPNAKGGELTSARDAFRGALKRVLAELRGRETLQGLSIDPYELLSHLVSGAVALYEREWNERPSPARLATLLRFGRNLALVGRRLTPGKYQMVLAGKNTVNDDYAYQLLRLADHYPFYEEDSELPEMTMQSETEGEADGEKMVLRLRLPRALQQELEEQLEELELTEPPEEGEEGSWQERWEEGEHHVSHLPQDAKIEGFFEYLRNKCKRLLAEQQTRTHEMQASLMDGLDLRETLRNLPTGKIFVRENLPGIGDVGPVVVVFHKQGEEHLYPHEKMWFAEHSGESDLALYSTEPGRKFDGPGISRCQYGGVMSLYPPSGRAWVWGNPRYGGSANRAEVLLKAAIDLSRKPIVAYVAWQGPSAEILSLAASRGIHIMYIPMETLSAGILKRVRTFHVLADREVRPLAPVYIN